MTHDTNQLAVVNRADSALADCQMPIMSMQQATERFNAMGVFVKTIMKEDVDYGKVPGTEKNTLLKPGAEKLRTFFGLSSRFQVLDKVEDWTGTQHGGEPLFYYVYRCQLYRGETLIAESDGSANSRESKHRWRWVRESEVPAHLNKATLTTRSGAISEPDFAIRKRETSGKFGKPAAYWDRFDKAIADGTARRVQKPKKDGGTMDAWEIGDTLYRVPNDDVASQINTLQKMAQKRALVAAVLLAVNGAPGPESLRRPRFVSGHEVKLRDGHLWTIPVARSIVRGSTLPKALALGDDAQTWELRELPEFVGLCRDAERVWETWVADATGRELDPAARIEGQDMVRIAVSALAVNYRLGPVEVSLLGLMSTDEMHEILRATIDVPELLRQQPQQKKTDAPPSAT